MRRRLFRGEAGDGVRPEDAGLSQDDGREVAAEGAAHEDLAVGEVDHAQDAVNHRVPEGNHRVDAAQGESLAEEAEPGADG